MKYIGRSSRKIDFHLEDLKLKIHDEEVREGVLTEEEHPRMEPHWPERMSVIGGGAWRRGVTGHHERKRYKGEAMV
jgi:hypothetical protein